MNSYYNSETVVSFNASGTKLSSDSIGTYINLQDSNNGMQLSGDGNRLILISSNGSGIVSLWSFVAQ